MNSWLFLVNSEPIELNLIGIFSNKYGIIRCWLRHYDKISPICKYSFIFSLWNYLVYRYSALTCLINDEQVFGPSQIFGKVELTFFINLVTHDVLLLCYIAKSSKAFTVKKIILIFFLITVKQRNVVCHKGYKWLIDEHTIFMQVRIDYGHKSFYTTGCVFTTLHFIRNVQTVPIS
jgi:hypothetical protein